MQGGEVGENVARRKKKKFYKRVIEKLKKRNDSEDKRDI